MNFLHNVLLCRVIFTHGFKCALVFLFARYLTEKVVPGNRVTVIGIYSIKKVFQKSTRVSKDYSLVTSFFEMIHVYFSLKALFCKEVFAT